MNVDQAPLQFRPITITLESPEEVTILARLIGRSSPAERQDYLADAGLARSWKQSRGVGLHDATYSFSRLYRQLDGATR